MVEAPLLRQFSVEKIIQLLLTSHIIPMFVTTCGVKQPSTRLAVTIFSLPHCKTCGLETPQAAIQTDSCNTRPVGVLYLPESHVYFVLQARGWPKEERPQQTQGAVHRPRSSLQQLPKQFQPVQPQWNLLQLRSEGATGKRLLGRCLILRVCSFKDAYSTSKPRNDKFGRTKKEDAVLSLRQQNFLWRSDKITKRCSNSRDWNIFIITWK